MSSLMNNNPFLQSGLANTVNGLNRQYPINAEEMTTDELATAIHKLTLLYDKRMLDTPLIGPTRRQLQNNEALRHSWEAFELVRKLQGK